MNEVQYAMCLRDFTLTASNGDCLELKRGEEYIVGFPRGGSIRVFSSFWEYVPLDTFEPHEYWRDLSHRQITREKST